MIMKDSIRKTESKFLKVVCSGCNNEQIIFNKPSKDVKCLVCGAELANATGGKGKVKSKVQQVY
jgi:small subunit ribosomal protein S27e